MKENKLKLSRQISLANFTTWNIGGNAEWLAEPRTIDEIKLLISWSKREEIPCNIIGAGSNLLINDSEIKGLSLCTRQLHGNKINAETGQIEALAGENIASLSRKAARAGLKGLEWAVGIPGTIGGAITMNAGAQGGCMQEIVDSIEVYSLLENKIYHLTNQDLNFAYRHSLIQEGQLLVLSILLQLTKGHLPKELTQITNENLLHRKNTQPYEKHTCGSVFRNPEPLKAAKLIESLGLKGKKIGGAEVSTKHANFIINTGNASAANVAELITIIQNKVKESYGCLLYPEVKQLGF